MICTAKHIVETADAINWLAGTKCPVTKRSIIKGFGGADIGYRIRNTEDNRKKYGERVIEHRDNWIVVATGNAAETVSRSWDKHPERIKVLVQQIKDKLKLPKSKVKPSIKIVSISEAGKFQYAYSPNGLLEE